MNRGNPRQEQTDSDCLPARRDGGTNEPVDLVSKTKDVLPRPTPTRSLNLSFLLIFYLNYQEEP